MNKQTTNKLIEDIGFIKAKVIDIEKHTLQTNGKVAELGKKVQKHEVILGKFGAGIAFMVFIISLAFNSIVNLFKQKV